MLLDNFLKIAGEIKKNLSLHPVLDFAYKDNDHTAISNNNGVLAQLARAFDWQSRGQGFDSPILHQSKVIS